VHLLNAKTSITDMSERGRNLLVTPKHSIGEWSFMGDFADLGGNVIALREKPKGIDLANLKNIRRAELLFTNK
jgi:hypothetical protein